MAISGYFLPFALYSSDDLVLDASVLVNTNAGTRVYVTLKAERTEYQWQYFEAIESEASVEKSNRRLSDFGGQDKHPSSLPPVQRVRPREIPRAESQNYYTKLVTGTKSNITL